MIEDHLGRDVSDLQGLTTWLHGCEKRLEETQGRGGGGRRPGLERRLLHRTY